MDIKQPSLVDICDTVRFPLQVQWQWCQGSIYRPCSHNQWPVEAKITHPLTYLYNCIKFKQKTTYPLLWRNRHPSMIINWWGRNIGFPEHFLVYIQTILPHDILHGHMVITLLLKIETEQVGTFRPGAPLDLGTLGFEPCEPHCFHTTACHWVKIEKPDKDGKQLQNWQKLKPYLLHNLRCHPTRCADKGVPHIFTWIVLSCRKPSTHPKISDHNTALLPEQNVTGFDITEEMNSQAPTHQILFSTAKQTTQGKNHAEVKRSDVVQIRSNSCLFTSTCDRIWIFL